MQRLLILLLAAALTGCAGSGDRRDDLQREAAVYERHAGAAERQIRYTSIRNWWPIGHHSVAFEVNRQRHYLVRLSGPCDIDLRMASTLRIVSARRNLLDEFDRIAVGGRECRIVSIRRLDMEAVEGELDEDRSRDDAKDDIEVEIGNSEAQDSGGT